MAWRDTLLKAFGPGFLGGVTFGQWVEILRENHFTISPACWPRLLALTSQSLQNSVLSWLDRRKIGMQLDEVVVPPPVFILGHWRSGTTHLHNLLTLDERFAFPNNYQCLFPHSFLTGESFHSRGIEFFLPKRRPMDNVEWTMQSPQEDEFALCNMSGISPYMGWVFQNRREHYDRYLTLREATDVEVIQWKAAFDLFLRKLTWKLKRPMILKSPPHTCRIKLLLEMYPQAKFIHIHRNPFTVFSSTRRLFQVNHAWHRVQRPRLDDLDDWILEQYRRMYDVFFEERTLIPDGQYHEIGFEELEQDPLGQVKQIYEALSLPDFSPVEAPLRTYAASLTGYQKNDYSALPGEFKQRIAERWKPSFEEWNYPPSGIE